MTSISCDACKKHISGARKDVNYVTVLDKDLCMSCSDKLTEHDQAPRRGARALRVP